MDLKALFKRYDVDGETTLDKLKKFGFDYEQVGLLYKGYEKGLPVSRVAFSHLDKDEMASALNYLERKCGVKVIAPILSIVGIKNGESYINSLSNEQIKILESVWGMGGDTYLLVKMTRVFYANNISNYSYKKRHKVDMSILDAYGGTSSIDNILLKNTLVSLDVPEAIGDIYNKGQLRQLRSGLISGVDISLYSNTRFSDSQMREIRLGLENVLDASVYANPAFEPITMGVLRRNMEEGYDVTEFANPDFDSDKIMYLCLLQSCKSNVYFTTDMSTGELSDIWRSCGVCVPCYKSLGGFDSDQQGEIDAGKAAGVDVSVYSNPVYTAAQMRMIRLGLMHERGFGWIYAQPEITAARMNRIFRVLNGQSLTHYADPFREYLGGTQNSNEVDINSLIYQAKSQLRKTKSNTPTTPDEVIEQIKASNRDMANMK